MRYLCFAASHRPESYNRKLVVLASTYLPGDAEIDLADYDELELPLFNDALREAGDIPPAAFAIADRIAVSDGFVIATPEYNWSFPGSLKNTLDWVSHFRPIPFAERTALLLSASPGKRGGVQGLGHLRTVLEALGTYVHPSVYCLGSAGEQFDGPRLASSEATQRLCDLTQAYSDFTSRLRR